MYNNKKILALIPARGGSKGIPHKNIALLNGKPLIEYTIDAVKKSKYIDECYVSTDDTDIAEVAQKNGIKVILRPEELASDTSKTIDAILHALSKIKSQNDYLVLLQPTQPLRQARHIDDAITNVIDNNYPSLLSVSPVKSHPLFIRTVDENMHLDSLLNESSTVRRQDFKKYYYVNGAVYINKIETINADLSFNDNEYAYIMEDKYDCDIDTPLDLSICERLIQINDKI